MGQTFALGSKEDRQQLTLRILSAGWDLTMLQKSWKPSSSSWKVAR